MAKSAMKVSDNDEENLLKLTPKQRLYLESRIQGLSVKMSAAAAGYSADSSRVYTDLENHPRIKALLMSATTTALQSIQISRNDVLQGFMDAVTSAGSSTELVMAWREIGKIIGAYAPEVKVVAHLDATAEKIAALDDKALLEMASIETFELPALSAEYEVLSPEPEDPVLSTEDPELSGSYD